MLGNVFVLVCSVFYCCAAVFFIKGACACVLKGFKHFAPYRIFCYQRITKHIGAYRSRQGIADGSSFKVSELDNQLHKEMLHSLYPKRH